MKPELALVKCWTKNGAQGQRSPAKTTTLNIAVPNTQFMFYNMT